MPHLYFTYVRMPAERSDAWAKAQDEITAQDIGNTVWNSYKETDKLVGLTLKGTDPVNASWMAKYLAGTVSN